MSEVMTRVRSLSDDIVVDIMIIILLMITILY